MNRWARLLVVALVGAIAGFAAPTVAFGQEAECQQVGRRVECYIKIVGRPGGSSIDAPLGPHVPFVWVRRQSSGLPGATFSCYREYPGVGENGVDVTVQEWGTGWVIVVIDPTNGGSFDDLESWITWSFDCEFPGDDPPQPPPPPPTPDQVREAFEDALIVSTELNPPPAWGGLTGLETWFWCTSPGQVTLDPPLVLNGYAVDAWMAPLLYTWSISGPASAQFSGPSCGTEPTDESGTGAAWAWAPQTAGAYTVGLTADWTMTWSLTYDFGDGPVTLPQTQYPSPIPVSGPPIEYSVDEYRGVLTG